MLNLTSGQEHPDDQRTRESATPAHDRKQRRCGVAAGPEGGRFVLVLIEKVTPWGEVLSRIVGAALLIWGGTAVSM